MTKLCLLYGLAPHYRRAIFEKIDNEFDCNWYFGNNNTDINSLDLSVLKNTTILKNIWFSKNVYFQKNAIQLLFKSEYNTYFILGDINCISTWIILLLKCIFFKKKKIYTWTHGCNGKNHGIKRKINLFFENLPDGIFLYGNFSKRFMISQGIQSEKLFVVHNSLAYDNQLSIRNQITLDDCMKNHFINDSPTIVFIGRLALSKRIDLLLNAIQSLNKKGKPFNVVLIGSGEGKQDLEKIVHKNNLDNQIWFYGSCYDEKINAQLIYNSDLCVSPGNVGLTAIHSLMFGTPVITSNDYYHQGPEFESIHEGITGAFFEDGDIQSLADTIMNWFNRPDYDREQIRQACYEEIDKSWNPEFQMNVIKKNLKVC